MPKCCDDCALLFNGGTCMDEWQNGWARGDYDVLDTFKRRLPSCPLRDPAENGECWGCLCDLCGQAPVKHGKWIDGKYMGADGCFVWHRECSLCGYEREDDNSDKDTLFCPNCGASMERSE